MLYLLYKNVYTYIIYTYDGVLTKFEYNIIDYFRHSDEKIIHRQVDTASDDQ